MPTGPYRISIDLGELFDTHANLVNELFPLVRQAVAVTAEIGAMRWKDAVAKARLWSVEKAAYIDSITYRMVGPFKAEISAEYDKADAIENGRPARDLKRALRTSDRARIVKRGPHAGMKYLIIPFRHNTPTPSGQGAYAPQMPQSIYAMAKTLAPSRLLMPGTRNSAFRRSVNNPSVLVPQNSYEWGGRLPEGLAPKLKEHHATDPYAGMVRFDTSTGGKRSSAYLTFRIMGEWSSGWVVPAQPGLHLAGQVAEELKPALDENVRQAVTLSMLKKS